jgi:hypothetical protein
MRWERPQLSMAGHGPERHADMKVLRDAANCSIALADMLPEGVAVKKGCDLQGSAAASIVTCMCNSRLSSARRHGSQ